MPNFHLSSHDSDTTPKKSQILKHSYNKKKSIAVFKNTMKFYKDGEKITFKTYGKSWI